MLLRWPKSMGMDRRRGTSLPQPVELRDILPTFLDAAEAPVPDHLDGRSLLELVRGQTAKWRAFIDLEHSMCYSKDHWTALTDGKRKYIYFDLEKDRAERHDRAGDPDYAGVLTKWRRRMAEHLSERGEAFVSDGKPAIRKTRLLYSPNYPAEEDVSARASHCLVPETRGAGDFEVRPASRLGRRPCWM